MRYAADLPVPGLLHGRLVLSPEAHARITSIDGTAARELDGVVAVLTAADLPIVDGASGRAGQPLARDEALWAGQPVALVVAESEAAAADGADVVALDLEPLPAVVDVEAAMAPDSPPTRALGGPAEASDTAAAHGGSTSGEALDDEDLSANVIGRERQRVGDADAALAGSAATATARFSTSWIHQGYLEPQVATAWVEFDGQIVISSATQGAFACRQSVADALGLAHDRVRVRPAPLGGGFGGKLEMLEPLVAAAALTLQRPVRVSLPRMDDFAATNPAPGQLIELEAGADAEGTFTGLRGRVICDRGINDEYGTESLSALLSAGPYTWVARDLRAYGVLTNRVPCGAYRGPGAPPAAFAVEGLIDELAERLGLDPIELRLRNVLREGDPGPDGQPWPVFGAAECLERVRDHPMWRDRNGHGEGEGVGMAIGYWPGGLEPTAAACRLDADGRLTVITGAVDMSGTETTFATIAAEAFGVPQDEVRVVAG
ncbi:MAG TPA: xanthine dehydrogenase family protein, partial [Solirubrobacteraceae bacterium]